MWERLLEHGLMEAKEAKNFKEGAAKCCLLQEAELMVLGLRCGVRQ